MVEREEDWGVLRLGGLLPLFRVEVELSLSGDVSDEDALTPAAAAPPRFDNPFSPSRPPSDVSPRPLTPANMKLDEVWGGGGKSRNKTQQWRFDIHCNRGASEPKTSDRPNTWIGVVYEAGNQQGFKLYPTE